MTRSIQAERLACALGCFRDQVVRRYTPVPMTTTSPLKGRCPTSGQDQVIRGLIDNEIEYAVSTYQAKLETYHHSAKVVPECVLYEPVILVKTAF